MELGLLAGALVLLDGIEVGRAGTFEHLAGGEDGFVAGDGQGHGVGGAGIDVMVLARGVHDVERGKERGALDALDRDARKACAQHLERGCEQHVRGGPLDVIGIDGPRDVGGVSGANADGQRDLGANGREVCRIAEILYV